jgi:hypothetical protein
MVRVDPLRWSRATAAWLRDPANLLFAALLVAQAVPLWCFTYFPSQDGPAHLENAAILRDYPGPHRLLHTFYEINPHPEPNWASTLLLAGLMYVVPPLVAEKLLLTGYLLLLPLAACYAVQAVRPGTGWLAILAVPLAPNLFVHMGFYNFCWSLPLFLFTLGYWLRHRERLGRREALALMALGLALYFCHLMSLVAAWVVMAVMVPWTALLEARRRRIDRRGRGGPVPGTVVAFLPALLLALWFVGKQGVARPVPPREGNAIAILLKLEALASYDAAEALVGAALVSAFALLTTYLLTRRFRRRPLETTDGLLAAAGAFLALYFVTPHALSGGLFVNYRLTLYPFFALLLWFAAQPVGAGVRGACLAVGAAAAVALLGLHVGAYARIGGYLEEYLTAAEGIEPETTLLPVSFAHAGRAPDGRPLSARIGPFRHACGYVVVRRPVVNLMNSEAAAGYFPIRYRPEVSPYTLMGTDPSQPAGGLEAEPPRVDFLGYERRTGQRVDYVLIWGWRDGQRQEQTGRAIFDQLSEGGYERVPLRSELVRLYRRQGGTDSRTHR